MTAILSHFVIFFWRAGMHGIGIPKEGSRTADDDGHAIITGEMRLIFQEEMSQHYFYEEAMSGIVDR